MSLKKIWCGKKSLRGCVATAAISSVLLLTACGGDSSSSGPNNNALPEVVAVKNKTISGISQKGPFVTGSVVKLYELDGESYAQTGKNFTGKITSDDGKFSISSVSLASQYALLEANGYFRNEIMGNKSQSTITLNALTDISDRKTVNINLLTHLEYERALYLVGKGKNVSSAKKQAESEILNEFGIKGEFASSEDLDIFSKGDGNAALLAFSVLMLRDLSEADFTELLTKFATDMEKDGIWDDEATKAKIADWAAAKDLAGELAIIRSNIDKWNLGAVPEFEKYVRNFWYTNYGLDECGSSNNGEIKATANKYSASYGSQDRFICKEGVWGVATDIECDTYGEKCSSAEVGKMIDGVENATNKYYCTINGWVQLMGGWNWDVPKEAYLNPEIAYDSMTDPRDGQIYKTVKIGGQVWMAENLNYADSVKTPSLLERSWCYNNKAENCAVAGRLYTWAAAIDLDECKYFKSCSLPAKVQGICPPGWRLPTKTEWGTLFTKVGGKPFSLEHPEVLDSIAGKILTTQCGGCNGCNGSDSFGFSALPAGYRMGTNHGCEPFCSGDYGKFFHVGEYALFWIAAEDEYDGSRAYSMMLGDEIAYSAGYSKDYGFSVRCLKDL
ncbi:fibrobacter succinogenes major paralogous domain-containing protein [Fibrobacter sp. UWB13]|uniref:fibrobacter succinogenes major paralogous domain-containing protein n=1 Tax=Fibrobacter sp. UWB13 TaxID=1896204 RepID=UPI000A0D470A|nr:fibrobacter succinogenes major paralogous domain-containing protein [Fibrobacter sp. UWB13]SMG15571.1 major paralogous domain-containing protein [Fibrobacter sp. UWB13]